MWSWGYFEGKREARGEAIPKAEAPRSKRKKNVGLQRCSSKHNGTKMWVVRCGDFLPEPRSRCSIEPKWKLSMESHQEKSCGRCASTLTGVKVRQFSNVAARILHMCGVFANVCMCVRVRACACVSVCVRRSSPRPAAVAAAGGNGLRAVQHCAHAQSRSCATG